MHKLSLVLLALYVGCSQNATLHQADNALTVIALGDAGEDGSTLRTTAQLVNDMYTGRHSGGKPDVLLFLGDNFYPIGLNIPKDDVESLVRKVLSPFRPTLEGLGRSRVHALAGNHDYYARNVIDQSVLFGLINVTAGPIGLSDRGNRRSRELSWWTYTAGMPAEATYPVRPDSPDSVQFIFYDSALPLRTGPAAWRPALDSLRRLLALSAKRKGIVWRVLCQHHPWLSVGKHAGYSVWDDEAETVAYLSNCDKDSNAVQWFLNFFDPEDLCAERYRAQIDSLRSVIRSSGVKIQFALTAHDHSLQLLSHPDGERDCPECPSLYIVSGAASKPEMVKLPNPPWEFTSAQPMKRGISHAGFAQLQFTLDSVRVVFYNSWSGEAIDMGGGMKEFVIARNGRLIEGRPLLQEENGGYAR
jgi:hypothetical protein